LFLWSRRLVAYGDAYGDVYGVVTAQDERRHRVGRFSVHTGDDVGIGLHGEGGCGAPKRYGAT
jgi:hypothetical protein